MKLQTFVAAWGALTGTTAILLQAVQFYRDRSILQLNPKHSVCADIANPKQRMVFELEVVNHGRRIAYLEAAGIEIPVTNPKPGTWNNSAELSVFPSHQTKSIALNEGQKVVMKLDPFPEGFAKSLGQTATAFVKDTRGRVFRKTFYISRPVEKPQAKS